MVAIAGEEHDDAKCIAELKRYAARHGETLRWYDFAGNIDRAPEPPDNINLDVIGRLVLINTRLTGDDAAWLLSHPGVHLPFDSSARLQEATPDSELYAAMLISYDSLRITGINQAKRTKLLHLFRPHTFPIVDSVVRRAYKDIARAVGAELGGKVSYWESIRRDLVEASDFIAQARAALASGSSYENALSRVADPRFWDALVWSVHEARGTVTPDD